MHEQKKRTRGLDMLIGHLEGLKTAPVKLKGLGV
jgi:hypothetical protein